MSIFVRNELETAYRQKWPVNFICRLALFESLSRDKDLSEEQFAMEQEILQKCMKKDLQFAFFRRLPAQLKTQYQLDDKTFVEYHTDPEARVTLYYALDTGLGRELQYQTEPLHNLYEGIFMKTFTLFYGESLRYYFRTEVNGKVHQTQERVIIMNKVEGIR